jgi:hypothetical protein
MVTVHNHDFRKIETILTSSKSFKPYNFRKNGTTNVELLLSQPDLFSQPLIAQSRKSKHPVD